VGVVPLLPGVNVLPKASVALVSVVLWLALVIACVLLSGAP